MKAIHKLNRLSLKELDPAGLVLVLQKEILANPDIFDYETIQNAMTIATFLHRKAHRSNRGDMPKTFYIEHPLRNTIRLLRWGCWDQDVIIASLLHDVIEDCADEIISLFLNKNPNDYTTKDKRILALSYIKDEFGEGVSYLVNAVSNDILPAGISVDEKNKAYADHVAAVITNAKVFAVKFADFVDNASGLYHNAEGLYSKDIKSDEKKASKRATIVKRATKYLPVTDIFENVFDEVKDILPLSGDAKEEMPGIFAVTKVRLAEIIDN